VRLVLALTVLLVGAPPALAAPAEIRAVDDLTPDGNNVWSPSDVTINVGETVTWRYDGTQLPHNVASTSPNWNVASPSSAVNPAPVVQRFDAEGTYTFQCSFHAMTMKGSVTVGSPPPPPPPPLSEQPWTNEQAAPTVLEKADETRPKLTEVRLNTVRNGARVRFRLSERARVSVRFTRAGMTVAARRRTFRAGAHRLVVRDRRLSGRYRVEVVARDLAGNRSKVKRSTLRL
jgi:plastocyanin